jgi:hypothetical protein
MNSLVKSINYLSKNKKKINKNNHNSISLYSNKKDRQFKTINTQRENYKVNSIENNINLDKPLKNNLIKINSLSTRLNNNYNNSFIKKSTSSNSLIEKNDISNYMKRNNSMRTINYQKEEYNEFFKIDYKNIVNEIYNIVNSNFNIKIENIEKLPNIIKTFVINYKKNFEIVTQLNNLYLEEKNIKKEELNELNNENDSFSNWINSTFSNKINLYYKKKTIINEFEKLKNINSNRTINKEEENDSLLYKKYCTQIMNDNNIKTFKEFILFIDKLLEENIYNDKFVIKMKKVLCTKSPSIFNEKKYNNLV